MHQAVRTGRRSRKRQQPGPLQLRRAEPPTPSPSEDERPAVAYRSRSPPSFSGEQPRQRALAARAFLGLEVFVHRHDFFYRRHVDSVAPGFVTKARESSILHPSNSRLGVTFESGFHLYDFALYIAHPNAVFLFVDPNPDFHQHENGVTDEKSLRGKT